MSFHKAAGLLQRGQKRLIVPNHQRLVWRRQSTFRYSIYNKNAEESKNGHYFSKALLTVVIPYTFYAIYVSTKASEEINKREELIKDCENKDFNSTLVKYSPLEILGRFANPFKEYRVLTAFEFFANRVFELFERNRGGIPIDSGSMDQLMPIHKPTWTNGDKFEGEDEAISTQLVENRNEVINSGTLANEKRVHTTWLGQSCNFVIYNGFKVLTDPLFSDFLIHETLGPKRITRMPAQIEEVPTPDIILVSHNHPDHLDFKSLEYWGLDGKKQPLWIVPKGLGEFMTEHKVANFIELSWWETLKVNKNGSTYYISCTPAMHWSGRSLIDTNRSLWCSFLLQHEANPILFHAGDTGYVWDLFKRISNRYGQGVKLALLPCGQYCPAWHQKPRHINPDEVLKIKDDLKARNVLGVHWGTFVLSGEYFREPKEKLEMLAEWTGVRDNCYCPELGKTITIE